MAWLDRWRNAIFFLALAVIVAGSYLASHLALRSDLSSLLPPSKKSVQDLAKLQKRARSFGNVLVMIDAPSPEVRGQAATELLAQLHAMDPALIATISTDDNAAARYGWEHRFQFATLEDLEAADKALSDRLHRAHLESDPLFVDIDDPDPNEKSNAGKLEALQKRLDDAERDAKAPPARLSADGKAQLVSLTVTFPASDVGKGRVVMGRVREIGAAIQQHYPGTTVDYAGSINISIFEHDSVIAGMALAAVITIVLVMIALFAYYRMALPVLGSLYALMTGVLFTLGFTQLTIGHLNLLSAFLTAIVVGNGINPGLIVLSRYGEELRNGTPARDAIVPALRGSLHGTLAASTTAAVAYAALIVTDFRGFRHFGIIGGVGMVACWLSTYSVLPVTLEWLARRDLVKARKPPAIGALLARIAPKPERVGRVLAFGALIVLVALAVTARYLIDDPFQKDWRDLQADGGEIKAQHVVDARMTARFARNGTLASPSYRLAMAVDRRDQVGPTVRLLRDLEAKRAKGQELFIDVASIDDLVPTGQAAKNLVLARIRKSFEDPILPQLPDDERARIMRLSPPPTDLPELTEKDIPDELGRLFVEQDGSVGRLIYLKGSPRFQTWNVEDRVVFAAAVRALPLPEGVVIGGEPLVIADIVDSMKQDTPIMVLVSLLGSILVVWIVVGYRRHGTITLVCGMAGVLVMIAACSIAGLKVHFLDLIALPITIGIGIDYAVNLTARDRADGGSTPASLLSTTGGAVLLCSFTTTVGYGSLLLSSNGGVRAFGLAAILGELACITMALVLAPALLARWRALASPTPAEPAA